MQESTALDSSRLPVPAGVAAERPTPNAAGRLAVALLCAALLPAAASAHSGGQPPATEPPAPPTHAGVPLALFSASDSCMACHNGLITPTGQDISIGVEWRASMMANAARDPYWQAAVRRETIDHPESQAAIEGECSICHMPMAAKTAMAGGGHGEVFTHLPVGQAATPEAVLAADGVSCTVCHQIAPEGLGEESTFTGGFVVDTRLVSGQRTIYGPFEVDEGRAEVMRSASRFRPAEGTHVQSSELCATCHTLYTKSLGPGGVITGELPEQVPYLEWKHSAYWREGKSCQSCHMPVVEHETPVSSVLGLPRAEVSRHTFRGGNFFMLRMLNRYRDELGVTALPAELEATANRTLEHLRTAAARVAVENAAVAAGSLELEVAVTNLAGHKLPSAYPSRRAWLHLTVRDLDGALVFESGALGADGAIAGNDNDAGEAGYEPHHAVIRDPGQVQIYEAILGDPNGAVTTGLLTAVRYLKDNRLLPRGFDRSTADPDVALKGAATEDADFLDGSDRVRYVVPLGGAPGPYRVEAVLRYQPIGFRWARNLGPYQSFETERFTRYWNAMSEVSATELARAEITVD
ncbi:MAG TPA: hypothetical protein VMV46_07975 [Thermoanaerobaculia bacterium]|nr:hypothetical protein [Thermoanaerobaculia bacterium]